MKCHIFPQTPVIVLFLFLLVLRVEGKEMVKVKAQTLTGKLFHVLIEHDAIVRDLKVIYIF